MLIDTSWQFSHPILDTQQKIVAPAYVRRVLPGAAVDRLGTPECDVLGNRLKMQLLC